jgi:hypothetical protein
LASVVVGGLLGNSDFLITPPYGVSGIETNGRIVFSRVTAEKLKKVLEFKKRQVGHVLPVPATRHISNPPFPRSMLPSGECGNR